MKNEFKFEIYEEVPTCRIKSGYHEEGKLGRYFGKFYIGDRWWALVAWDYEEDPDLFKLESIEIKKVVYKDA